MFCDSSLMVCELVGVCLFDNGSEILTKDRNKSATKSSKLKKNDQNQLRFARSRDTVQFNFTVVKLAADRHTAIQNF